jgi:hypothetical protein
MRLVPVNPANTVLRRISDVFVSLKVEAKPVIPRNTRLLHSEPAALTLPSFPVVFLHSPSLAKNSFLITLHALK